MAVAGALFADADGLVAIGGGVADFAAEAVYHPGGGELVGVCQALLGAGCRIEGWNTAQAEDVGVQGWVAAFAIVLAGRAPLRGAFFDAI